MTLLGITSGKNLSQFAVEKNGEIIEDRSYIVTAIVRTDGGDMPSSVSDPIYDEIRFYVSPLIQGEDPVQINSYSLDTTYTEFIRDGVLYRLMSCNNIEMFADRTVYLCVCDGEYYNPEAYTVDDATGEMERNDSYEGVNALFELPLDSALADSKAAEAYLESIAPKEDESQGDEQLEEEALLEKITPETIDEYAERLEDSVQILEADEDNMLYRYTMANGEEFIWYIDREREFPEGRIGMSERILCDGVGKGVENLRFLTFTLNEDSTVTGAVYLPKQSE